MKNYEKIIGLNSEIKKIKLKIELLRTDSVLELYKMGYSMDRISSFLMMGKVNVHRILHQNKIKIRNKKGKK